MPTGGGCSSVRTSFRPPLTGVHPAGRATASATSPTATTSPADIPGRFGGVAGPEASVSVFLECDLQAFGARVPGVFLR